MQVHYQKRW